MARVRFVDEMGKAGEVDLEKMKPGDLVKFKADFTKRGDGDDEKKVSGGELGEVLEVYPMMPGILIEVPCEHSTMGSRVFGETELVISPDDVLLVVDGRDPRISGHRIETEAALAPVELEAIVRGFGLPPYLAAERRVVVAVLTRAGARNAARTVARTTNEAWADFVLGSALARTAAHISEWLPLVLWAMHTAKGQFPGQGNFSLKNRRHVSWALQQLAEDIGSVIPAHELDWNDEDQENSTLVQEIDALKGLVERSSDEEWMRTLPKLVELMDDPVLENDYRKWMGLPVKDDPKRTQQMQQLEDYARGTQGLPPKGPSPMQVEHETKWQQHQQTKPPELPEALAPPPFEPPPDQDDFDDLGDIELEPPGQPAPPVPPPVPPAPAATESETRAPAPLPPAPSRYDVPVMGEEPRGPHEWATPPAPASRVPISVFPGFEQGKVPRTIKVWAEPEMLVENRQTGESGTVVGTTPGDGLLIDVLGPSGLPVGDEPQTWDAMDVRLSPQWEFPVTKLTPDEMASWRKTRHLHQKDERRKQSDAPAVASAGPWNGLTVVSAVEVIGGSLREDNTRTVQHHDGGHPEAASSGRSARADGRKGGYLRSGRAERSFGRSEAARCLTAFVLGDEGDRHSAPDSRVALAPLGVKELQRALAARDPLGIISAYTKGPKKENQRAHGDLMAELQRRGYSPGQIRPLRGQYFGPAGEMKAEQSILVMGMTYEDAMELGKMFGQESVIWKSPDGVVGAFYTDGSGRVNYALTPDGDLALGPAAAPRIEPRRPKPVPGGPPAKEDPWSKARGIGFEFGIDWGKTFDYDPAVGPPSVDEARESLIPAIASTIVTAAELLAPIRA